MATQKALSISYIPGARDVSGLKREARDPRAKHPVLCHTIVDISIAYSSASVTKQ